MIEHDLRYVYATNITHFPFDSPRLPSLIINKFYNVIFPSFFHIHNLDFRSDIVVCSITSLLYMLMCYFFFNIFHISRKDKKPFLERYENIFLFPLAFLILTIVPFGSLIQNTSNYFFCGMSEFSVAIEYCGGYIVYFPFFIGLFYILMNNIEYGKRIKIAYFIVSLLLGMWSEFVNMPAFITVLIILPVIFIFDKEKFKNKSFITMLLGLFIGLFLYYFVIGNFDLQNIGSIKNYSVLDRIPENLEKINIFNEEFLQVIFLKMLWTWVIYGIAVVIMLLKMIVTSSKEQIGKIILFGIGIVLGYLITCYATILVAYRVDYNEPFIFSYYLFPAIGYHLVIFSLFMFSGCFYYNSNRIIQKLFIGLVVFLLVFSSYKLMPRYNTLVDLFNKSKIGQYNLEKTVLIYSIFGESAILPVGIIWEDYLPLRDNGRDRTIENSWFDEDIIMLGLHFKQNYQHEFKGVFFKDEDYAKAQLEKRVKLLGNFEDKYNFLGQVQYSNLKNYDNIQMTLEKIEELEKEYGANEILLKAKAYYYFNSGDYDKAKVLYNKYLKIVPKDIDALLNLATIYETENNSKKLAQIYEKIVSLDKRNRIFLYKIMKLNYDSGNYNEALKYAKILYNERDDANTSLNIAIIYKALNNYEEAIKYIYYSKNRDVLSHLDNSEVKIYTFDEFVKYKGKLELVY